MRQLELYNISYKIYVNKDKKIILRLKTQDKDKYFFLFKDFQMFINQKGFGIKRFIEVLETKKIVLKDTVNTTKLKNVELLLIRNYDDYLATIEFLENLKKELN
jgi:hypothetical protein